VQLFLARVGVGAGEAGCVPPAQSILCDYVPLKRRAGVLAFHNFGLVAGMMLGMALAGMLNERIGWRWTLVVLGLPGVGLAVLVRLTLREPERGRLDVVTECRNALSLRRTLSVLWACRTYRFLMFFTVLNGFVQYGLNQWWPSFYSRSFGLSLSVVGVSLGTVIGVGSGVGLLIGGASSNWAARYDVRLPLWIGAGASALALPAALGSLFVSSSAHSIMLVGLTSLLWCVTTGPFLATLYSVTPPQMRATAGAVMIFFTSVLGFGLGPIGVGVLSDLLTPALHSQALRYALIAPASLLPIAAFALYVSTRTLATDLRMTALKIEPHASTSSSIAAVATK
jgi:predicted MFS family arabinose efflux permease